jgi:hypothetical protein
MMALSKIGFGKLTEMKMNSSTSSNKKQALSSEIEPDTLNGLDSTESVSINKFKR